MQGHKFLTEGSSQLKLVTFGPAAIDAEARHHVEPLTLCGFVELFKNN